MSASPEIITESDIVETLPAPVKKWLLRSGIIGKEYVENLRLQQLFTMKFNVRDKKWSTGKAEQFFTIPEPSFDWSIRIRMNNILPLSGRDIFRDGIGSMKIKLLSLFPVVNVSNDPKTNESTLQRYLSEIMWFPSAALSSWLIWEPIDDRSARALMMWKGTTGSGVFYFSDEGDIERFETKRFKESSDTERIGWRAEVLETREMEGVRIPVKASVTWELEEGDWTWAKIEITKIAFNVT